jgi:hypothetical protein
VRADLGQISKLLKSCSLLFKEKAPGAIEEKLQVGQAARGSGIKVGGGGDEG